MYLNLFEWIIEVIFVMIILFLNFFIILVGVVIYFCFVKKCWYVLYVVLVM